MNAPSASIGFLWVGLAAVLAPASSTAFTFESIVQAGCHERITARAVEQAGWPLPAPRATVDDRTLADNVTFHTPSDSNLWLLSILIGVRDNDLHGYAPSDLPELSGIHNGAQTQDEHCLRSMSDDGAASGDEHALTSCRGFILSELAAALADDETLDLGAVEQTMVALRFERTSVPVSRYAFHLGRACHALQDSFAHSFRTHDGRSVVSVLNYVGPALVAGYQPSVGGHAHLSSLDGCDEDDSATRARVTAATDATAALLAAVGAPGARAERLRRAGAVLDQWVSYVPGCSAENGWCGNDEALPVGCTSAGSSPQVMLVLLGLWLAVRRARLGRGRGPSRASRLALLVLGVAGSAAAGEATSVDSPPQLLVPADTAPSGPSVTADAPIDPAPVATTPGRFGLHAAGGLSVDRGSVNVTFGSQLALTRRLTLGLDVEYSPWFDVLSATTASGTLNAYASASFTWANEGILSARSAVDLGGCALLFNTPGARAGSFGPFLGAAPLRLDVRLSPAVELEFSPELILAAPSLHGVPFVYHQYRATMGVRWAL